MKNMPQSIKRVAIIGGGPAGVSLARFLSDNNIAHVVFEKEDVVGGKSFSFEFQGRVIELGTCYTTLNHQQTKRWMKECGITLTHLGKALFDSQSPAKYANQGAGAPLALQALKYSVKAHRLKSLIKKGDQGAISEGSLSTKDWLEKNDLHKIVLAMHRLQTVQGYGYIQDTSIAQTLLWCDMKYVLTGLLNAIHMPKQGWSEFWRRMSVKTNIKTSSNISKIERFADCVEITVNGVKERFDYLVSTIPIDDFAKICELSEAEENISSATYWRQYTTTLISSPDWFTDVRVQAFSSAMIDKTKMGEVFGGRFEGQAVGLQGNLYVTGQYHDGMSDTELRELLYYDAKRRGFTITSVVKQCTYKYGPIFDKEAIAKGLLEKLVSVQGENRTWHGGAGFSHELINSVVAQSKKIAILLERQIKADDAYSQTRQDLIETANKIPQ